MPAAPVTPLACPAASDRLSQRSFSSTPYALHLQDLSQESAQRKADRKRLPAAGSSGSGGQVQGAGEVRKRTVVAESGNRS